MEGNKLIWIIAVIMLVVSGVVFSLVGSSSNYTLDKGGFGFFGANTSSSSYQATVSLISLPVDINIISSTYAAGLGYIQQLFDLSYPLIAFVAPTPTNGTSTSNNSITINVSITEANLNEFNFDWNGTNYTHYNDSLILMYNFDNISALGENNTYVIDMSGNGNNGTANADATTTTSGRYNGAFEFDGVDDYIDLGGMELINTDATFSFWIKFSSDKEWQTVIGSKNGESAWTSGFLFGGADLPFNDVYFWGCNKEGVITFDITTNLNTWQHFAASYDYSNQSVRLYHNGAYNNTDICTDNGDINMTNIILGAYGSSIGDEFNGTLDEVRIWNRSLTDAEINQTYHSNLKKYDTNKWEFYTNQTNLVAGNYTYQAHAIDTDGAGNETEVRYLEIPDLIPPTTPTLYTPIDGNNTIVDRTPTLIWNNSFDANGDTITYELMVGTNSSFPSPTINQTNLTEGVADTTNYTITDALTTDIPYYWKVRAYDETEYSDWSTSFNFTVESYVSISLPVAAMNFTSLNLSRSYDTTDRDPNPFVIQNNGNVLSNLTITGNQFFASGAFPGSNYQFKIQENETGSITNASSTTTWTNMPLTSSTIDIYELNWNDTKDTAEMHLKLAVPADEPPGIKSVQINFTVP